MGAVYSLNGSCCDFEAVFLQFKWALLCYCVDLKVSFTAMTFLISSYCFAMLLCRSRSIFHCNDFPSF